MTVRSFVSIFCVSLAVATALRFVAHHQEQQIVRTPRLAPISKPQNVAATPRRIYPYSVIPGGAYSGEELALARRVDRVVAAHYSDFDAAHVSVRALPQDTLLYVSYRKADRVYWTANKRRVPKGESVLCDGARMARARCGNRLSAVPQFPVAAGPQPTEQALNAPELPPGLELSQAPLFTPQYDAPVMPLLLARDRMFPFPTGNSGASPLEQAFPASGLHSPMMVVADLPFGAPGAAAIGPGGTSPGGTSPGGTTSGGSSPGGTTPGGTTTGGTTPGGTTPGGTTSGGPLPGSSVPEPADAALIAVGAAALLIGYQPVRRRRSTRR